MADDNDVEPREGAGSGTGNRRQLISGANAAVVIASTIAIAFLANAIVSQFSRLRIDMTENQLYTLSEASKDVVRDFDQPVQVKAFISANMPPPMHTLRRRVRDMLTEYRAASGGNLQFDIYSPGSEDLTDKRQKEIEQDAESYGCEKVGLRSGGEDRLSVRTVFKCIAFVRGGGQNQEVIKDLSTGRDPAQANFEYEFTKALMNLQNREPRKVAFVQGFGGLADRRGFIRQIRGRFDELFDGLIQPTSVDLSSEDASIPDDVSSLVILNPTQKFGRAAKFKIDQFVQNGGSVGWYQSATGNVQQNRQRRRRRPKGQRQPLETDLPDLFENYGLKFRKDLVLDRENGMMAVVPYEGKRALARHPATFTTSQIDQSLPFTKNFGTLAFPAPSSVQITAAATDDENIETFQVVQTEESAARRPEAVTDLSIGNLREPAENEENGPFTIVGALQGDVPSFFADKEPPEGMSMDESDGQTATSGRVLLVGSGDLFQPSPNIGYNRRMTGLGQRFFFASLEWLAQDSALAKIRGKTLPRLINEVQRSKKRWIQFVNIAGVPAVFALLGVLMMVRRGRRKERIRGLDWK